MQKTFRQLIDNSNTIFLDFDGVIKDSVSIKASAFEALFSESGFNTSNLIKTHHLENGGMSRYEKIPLYLAWSGLAPSEENISKYCHLFSSIVKKAVISSPWVPGVIDFLESAYKIKKLILLTATPKDEIDEILKKIKINHFFKEVYGSPSSKIESMSLFLKKFSIDSNEAIMIGDSYKDYEAAKLNNVSFILRCTDFNLALQSQYSFLMFNNFNDE